MKCREGEDTSIKFSVVSDPCWGERSNHVLKKIGSDKLIAEFVIKENKVSFSNVSVEDSGTYIISCRNDAGEGSARFVLHITPVEGNNCIIITTLLLYNYGFL